MKRLLLILASVFLAGIPVSATTTTNSFEHNSYSTFVRGYGNSFIFVEDGIEFAVFPDGQFDFNVLGYGPRFSAYADFGGASISFNTGYSYDAYVQYDDYGAVIQIENVPIYYDYYGRITRAGNVRINYNGYGYVTRVGGLYVHYNAYNRFSHCTGYINTFNRYYVVRPWHRFYARPLVDFCIVLNRPYRRYYQPIRHTYYRPYRDNFRPRVSYSSSRRGAVAQQSTRRSDRYIQSRTGRRSNESLQGSRRIASTDQSRSNRSRNEGITQIQGRRNNDRVVSRERTVTRSSTPRSATTQYRSQKLERKTSTPRVNSKPRRNSEPRVSSKSRTTSKPKVNQSSSSKRKQEAKQRSPQRSKSSKSSSKRTSESIRHKSRASSSKKPQARSSRRRN